MLSAPHIELHDKIVYSVITTLMEDDLLEITLQNSLGMGIRRFSAKTPCGRTLRQNGEDCRSPGFQESAFLQRFRRKEPAGTFRLVDPALSQSLFELQKFVNAKRHLVLVLLCPPVG